MERGLVRMQLAAQDLAAGYYDDLLLFAPTASFVRGWMGNEVVRGRLQSRHSSNFRTSATFNRVIVTDASYS